MREKNASALIEIDGGVDLSNYEALVQAGADVLVAGNAVFGSAEPIATIAALKQNNSATQRAHGKSTF